jgi:hypothetical protein
MSELPGTTGQVVVISVEKRKDGSDYLCTARLLGTIGSMTYTTRDEKQGRKLEPGTVFTVTLEENGRHFKADEDDE